MRTYGTECSDHQILIPPIPTRAVSPNLVLTKVKLPAIIIWYHNSYYFRSQIFHVRNFCPFHVCAIYSLRIILLVNNIRVRNFRRFGWNENYLTTKNSQITVVCVCIVHNKGALKRKSLRNSKTLEGRARAR